MICRERSLGLPRWRGLRDIREVQWFGHSALRTLAHAAYRCHHQPTRRRELRDGERSGHALGHPSKIGYVYVVRMTNATGSISFDVDQHVVLARLQSACPPVAKRPHDQDGFLVGRFPLYQADASARTKSSLRRRLVAKFCLVDDGSLWDADFPPIGTEALNAR
jgi:hypothetical protein